MLKDLIQFPISGQFLLIFYYMLGINYVTTCVNLSLRIRNWNEKHIYFSWLLL